MASTWRKNMLRYFSAVFIGSVSFEKEIVSEDKYPSICSRQMEAIVFIILKNFSQHARAVLKIRNITQIFPSFSWGISRDAFRPIARELIYSMDET